MALDDKYADVTIEDIDIVATRLHIFASRYGSLLRSVVRHVLLKTPQNDEIIDLDGTGLTAKRLFDDPHSAVCSLPDSFGIGDFKIGFHTPLAGAFLLVCPKNKIALTTSEMVALIPMSKSAVEQQMKKKCDEDKFMRKLNPNHRTLPKGQGLLEKLCVCGDAIGEWMRLMGSILDYYIAAIEPLLSRNVISPTLGGQNEMLEIEISKFHRRWLDTPFDEEDSVAGMTAKEMAVAIFDEHYRRYDDFMVSIAELRREGIRRISIDTEIEGNSQGGNRRTRTSSRYRKAMLHAMWGLSTESTGKFTAYDVWERMKDFDSGIGVLDFKPDQMSHGKRELLSEHSEMYLTSPTSYRLTPKSCAQLGQTHFSAEKKKAKKTD